jgi:hypothetical protein
VHGAGDEDNEAFQTIPDVNMNPPSPRSEVEYTLSDSYDFDFDENGDPVRVPIIALQQLQRRRKN